MTLARRAAVSLLLCGALLGVQTGLQEVSIRTHAYTPPSLILRTEANLVEAGFTVRDNDGHPVAGLKASDFEVLDNGVAQKITAFSELRRDQPSAAPAPESGPAASPAADAPPEEAKWVTFFFDDVHTSPAGLPFLKKAARAFMEKGIKPSDRFSISTASGEGELDFTNQASLFAEKFDGLHSHNFAASWAAYQTQTYNMIASLRYAAMRLAAARGRRILLVISHGFYLRPGELALDDFIDDAFRWNIMVQAIYAKGLDITPPELDPQQLIWWDNARWFFGTPLQNMADRTGGHFFKDTNDFAAAMEEAVSPEVTYLLAFRPGARDGKEHKLEIRFTSKRRDSIEFRPGYFSRQDDSEKRLSARAAMDDAVFSKETLRDVAAVVTLSGGQPRGGEVPIAIAVTLDVNQLQFATSHGRHMQQIVFLMTLLDAKGGFVTGKESIMTLALTDRKLAALKKDGLRAVATLDAPPGTYQVRTVVREGVKGGLTASTAAMELPGHR